ncbi:MAG: hypothetical protein KatS3mg009_2296 [Acidimicrobiia bacterium]|nr:MAG: hypothetical protein KatS3mg009_2296 [Acidimicrobiia bacterium]
MSDDEFDDEADLDEDLDEEVLEELDAGDDDLLDDDVLEEVLDDDLDLVVDDADTVEAVEETPSDEEDDIVDLDEELHPDDVEEALDVVLRERTAATGLEDDEDEEEDERGDGGEGGTKIVPRRPGEFLCKSCFLVLPRHQLADEKRMICRDCA